MSFLSSIVRANAENPSTSLSNPAGWLVDRFTGSPTDSGVTVNHKTAMHLSAVFSAVTLLSRSISMLPLNVIFQQGRTKEIARDHPVHRLINREPNKLMTSYQWREIIIPHIFLWGNSFSIIKKDPLTARPTSLLPVHPDRMEVELVDDDTIKYTVDLKEDYTQEEILHIAGFGFDGLMGKPVIEYASDNIGLSLAAQKFASLFYRNGGNHSAVMEADETFSKEGLDRYKKTYGSLYQNIQSSHDVPILPPGLKFKKINFDAEQSQLLETRKIAVTEVARWFNVPPHMIGDLERATFSNIAAQDLNYTKYSVQPIITKVEQEINRKLYREDEKANHFTKFNLEALLRADPETRANLYKGLWETGSMDSNEIRNKEDMNPYDGGDDKYVPMNFQPVGKTTNNE